MWKMFEAPMAKQYTRCDEYIGGSDDGGASSGDISVNCADQLSRLQVKNESESPPPAIPWNAFPDEQMAQLPVSPPNVTRTHQEETSTDDIDDKAKIAKGGIAPRTRRPHRVSRPGDLQRRKHTTHPLLRESSSRSLPRDNSSRSLLRENSSRRIDAATLEGARQKQVQPEAPKAKPPLPLESQQDMGRDDSKNAIEAKVGFRRRQCTRPLLRVDSKRKVKVVPPAA
jgi:hypothetical protein